MNFKVDTDALRTAKDRLRALATDTDEADTYKTTYLNITGPDNGVFFVHIDDVNTDVVAKLNDVISRLKRILDNSGLELGAAATWYDETDAATERRLDGQIDREAPLPDDEGYQEDPDFDDTVPEDPGDWEPPEDHDPPPSVDDDEIILAPGPPGYLDEPQQPGTVV